MNKALKYSLLFCSILLFGLQSNAQTSITKFSSDSIQFLEEMTALMELDRKKETKVFMKEFEPVWYGGKFSEEERNAVYNTCNFMLKKKMLPFPDFRDYLFCMMSFIKSDQSIESLRAWQKSLEQIIESKKAKRQFPEYLKFSSALFENNSIYYSNSTVWKSSDTNYRFTFKDNKPILVFAYLDLICLAKKDSSVIYNTKGTYYPLEKIWIGKGGKINWVRAGFAETEVYAEIGNYRIKVKSSSYEADSVMFYNSKYFDKPLLGKLQEKVLANVTPEKASYPRFDSYNKRFKIYEIAEGVDFDGGFSQQGGKFVAKGNEIQDTYLVFKRDNIPFMIASSKSFVIRPDRFTSKQCAVSFILGKDSIIHPAVKLNFNVSERKLTLLRTDEGISQSPYFNSFHKLDMYFEALYWKIDGPFLEFRHLEGSSDKSARFESEQYYKEYIFDKLQGIDRIHPLVGIRGCAREMGQDELYVSEVAKYMKLPATQVRPMLMKLATLGYLYYDFDDDRIRIKEKLHHYVRAKAAQEDYDVLKFSSTIDGQSNATLNLLNYDLTIRGVKNVLLSDTQKVYLFPKEHTVVVKKNRDFKFTGVINAGKFEFFATDCYFNYDEFIIDMPNIDSLRIWANTKKKDEQGSGQERRVLSVLEQMKGVLYIDEPKNKSHIEDFPTYPIFDSQKDSYVFYDKPGIQKGVYDKDKFYFHVDSFDFDSLRTFDNNSVQLEGTMLSAGIFPDFEEKLRIMPDYSLGFERSTPPDGYPMYGGKGQFYDKIRLSNKGMRGNGKLTYVTSTTMSDDFIFFPDSMNVRARNHVIEERPIKVEFPPVSAHDIDIHWEPHSDFMLITVVLEPIAMYDGSKLDGHVKLSPKGLTGGGLYVFEQAELEADLYTFKFSEFRSDTADFRLKSIENSALSFSTNDVNAHIDFKKREGKFLSNGGGSFIEFPVNQYICFMDKFTWFMDDESIELGADEVSASDQATSDVKLEGSKFISIHEDQDSLSFYAPKAKYDIRKNIIFAKDVRFIPVADALVYPDSGKVTIRKRAKMDELTNAKIVANSVTKYHTLYEANIKVKARKSYTANGKYDYKDENKQIHTFVFEDIKVDTTFQTVADGKIEKEEGFSLSPAFMFSGDVFLRGNARFLIFDGVTSIKHPCESVVSSSFKFKEEINPLSIYIPIIDTSLTDEKGNDLAIGLMMGKDSAHVYSTFLTPLKNKSDISIVSAVGYMYFDKRAQEYKVSSKEKIGEMSLPGSYISLSNKTCDVYGEGKLDFGANLGRVESTVVGNVNHNLVSDSLSTNVMILLDFFFIEKNLEEMAKNISDFEGLEPVNFDREVYERGLREIMGKQAGDKLISQVNLYGNFKKFPSELNKALFINELHMYWSPETQSYKSSGKIGIGNCYKKQVNKYVDGYVEIVRKRSGDEISIYIELDRDNWYFFTYKRNMLQAVSSIEKFNNEIKDLKADKRKMEKEKGKDPYSFMLSTTRRRNDFVKRFVGDE
ncbi:MAG: hypothetical protein JKY53_03865 [Flavobacteriales bacterium]|nr:hypothetical protein [Flavobacteriales bacterium]